MQLLLIPIIAKQVYFYLGLDVTCCFDCKVIHYPICGYGVKVTLPRYPRLSQHIPLAPIFLSLLSSNSVECKCNSTPLASGRG